MNSQDATLAALRDKLRASPLLVLFVVMFAITAFLNPAKVGLTVWGIAKLGMGGYLGYWIDRLSPSPLRRTGGKYGNDRGGSDDAPAICARMRDPMSVRTPVDLIEHWTRAARDLEADAARVTTTPAQKRLLEMHARVKRGCAQELRLLLERGKDGRS